MLAHWKHMPRNNEKELALADAYYDDYLMPWAQEHFLNKPENKNLAKYYGLILTMGSSWQPLALSISALKPKHILFIGTEAVMNQMIKLVDFLKLQPEQYEFVLIERSNAASIYNAINLQFSQWREKGKVALDITGGTKAMVAAAAMMGALLAMDIYYVESNYLSLYRRPEPGSESLKLLAKPNVYLTEEGR